MDIKSRKNYVLYTSIGFIVGFILGLIIYFINNSYLGSDAHIQAQQSMIDANPELDIQIDYGTNMKGFNGLWIPFGFGYLVFSLISMILIAVNFFKTTTISIRILAIIFFPLTYFIISTIGMLGSIPYYIYQVIIVYRNRRYVQAYF